MDILDVDRLTLYFLHQKKDNTLKNSATTGELIAKCDLFQTTLGWRGYIEEIDVGIACVYFKYLVKKY